jgi:hypothetical protein
MDCSGGYCRKGRYLDLKKCLNNFETKGTLKLEKLEEKNVKKLGILTNELGMECDLRRGNALYLH